MTEWLNNNIAAVDSDSSDGSGQIQVKTFWKGVTILEDLKNMHNSREGVKIKTFPEVGKKLIWTLMDDSEGFKTSVEKVTADVVEIARELELEVEPKDLIELLKSQDYTLTEEEVTLMDEQGKWFLEIESTFSEDIADCWNGSEGFRILQNLSW